MQQSDAQPSKRVGQQTVRRSFAVCKACEVIHQRDKACWRQHGLSRGCIQKGLQCLVVQLASALACNQTLLR